MPAKDLLISFEYDDREPYHRLEHVDSETDIVLRRLYESDFTAITIRCAERPLDSCAKPKPTLT